MLTFERELAFAFAFEDTLGFLVTLRLDAGMNEAAVEAATAVALAVTLALDLDRDRDEEEKRSAGRTMLSFRARAWRSSRSSAAVRSRGGGRTGGFILRLMWKTADLEEEVDAVVGGSTSFVGARAGAGVLPLSS